jgi:hypothetical protein
MTDRDPDLVLYGEDHLYAPDREEYVADIEDREPDAILLEELVNTGEDEADRLVDLYDSFGTIERAREHLSSEYDEDPLPEADRLYEAVEPGIGERLAGAYETVRDIPERALYRIAGIEPGFGDEQPDGPDDLATTPVYAFDADVLERLAGAVEEMADENDDTKTMTEFYEYLAAEQDVLTRISHEIYDHAARRRRQGEDVAVAGCDIDRGDIDLEPDEEGVLGPAEEAARKLERANRQREGAMAETAREYVETTDGTVAMVVGDGHLGYTGLENRLRFDDIDMEVDRSGQDDHRRREQLAGLVYFRTMRSEASSEASERFAELLEE